MNQEQDILTIICSSGEASNHAFKALDYAAKGDFDTARNCILEGRASVSKAHKLQSEYLFAECGENSTDEKVSLLMVHAQDHLMNAILALDMV